MKAVGFPLVIVLSLNFLQVNGRHVAFCASATGAGVLKPHERLPFYRVRFNLGGAYDSRHAFFNCPDNGLYMFYATVLARGYSVWFETVQDGHQKAFGQTGAGPVGAGGQMAMVKCRRNSHVWVRRTGGNPKHTQSIYGDSTFCGVKIAD